MKKKFTPGPWIKRVTKNGDIIAVIPKKYGERVIETVLKTGKIYDDDCGVETCCCVEEHANARLIAAAPDLLEALEDMLSIAVYANEFDPELMADERISIAKAAISKALNIK